MSTSAFLELGYKTDIISSISNTETDLTSLKRLFSHTILFSIGIRF